VARAKYRSCFHCSLGANTTLLDYSENQIRSAKYIHSNFETGAKIIQENLLQFPSNLVGKYDVSMSFGTAEHFFGDERQKVFAAHAGAVRSGGLVIVWVPNKRGLLFNFVRGVRKRLGKETCPVDEIPFTHKELRMRGEQAGLTDIDVKGGDTLLNDFSHHIIDFPRWFGTGKYRVYFTDVEDAAERLRHQISLNCTRVYLWNDLFTYPLILIGRKP
jgi:hypothetical protein